MADSQPAAASHRPTKRLSPQTAFLLIAIFVGLWLIWSMRGRLAGPQPENQPGVGEELVFLELAPLTGNPPPLSTSDLQGHVTLLSFWGTWCPPCRIELPHVAELRKHYADQEAFRLAAISYPPGGEGDDLDLLRIETELLLERLNLDLPTYSDPDGKTLAAIDRHIGFRGFPTVVLLDRRGVLRAVWSGYRPHMETEIQQYIDRLLNEKHVE